VIVTAGWFESYKGGDRSGGYRWCLWPGGGHRPDDLGAGAGSMASTGRRAMRDPRISSWEQ
jgi:hypothetical protein